jgi:hypothetical protein
MSLVRSAMRGWSRSLSMGLVIVLSVVITGTGTAQAAAGTSSSEFAQQAKMAGLSAAEARFLQSRVDGYLKKLGGKQTAANEIQTAEGAVLTLTLPGESKVRSLTGSSGAVALSGLGCPYYNLCAWQLNYGMGDQVKAYSCSKLYWIPWTTHGSFENNQTPGTLARLENYNGGVVDYTFAYQISYDYDWLPIFWIDPC